jgi:hypothetical protein
MQGIILRFVVRDEMTTTDCLLIVEGSCVQQLPIGNIVVVHQSKLAQHTVAQRPRGSPLCLPVYILGADDFLRA